MSPVNSVQSQPESAQQAPLTWARRRLVHAALVLGALWTAGQLVLVAWTTGNTAIGGVPAVVALVSLVVLAVSSGFVFTRYGTRRSVVAAAVYGGVVAGALTSWDVLASQSEDAVPWGAVVMVNFAVNGGLTAAAVAIGAALGSRSRRRANRTR